MHPHTGPYPLSTLHIAKILSVKKCEGISQLFSHKMNNRHPLQLKKIKILGALWELPAKQHCQYGQFAPSLR